MKKQFIVAAAMLSAGLVAQAAPVYISGDISTSTNLTALPAGDYYSLTNQIYVLPGASLTIEAGAIFKSGSASEEGGSLAVCRGARIYVNGTKANPVIMTSYDDPMTSWQEGANKWGNLTLMGKGLISASHYDGDPVGSNTKTPTGLNEKQMEGLTGGSETYYGGNDDNDNSGSISYLSLRYGGKVIGAANELNGMSLGGIGRETDIHHIEVMNNVDDGIEIWGGTVNLKYLNIWNIGDDSFDVDEGWRGKAQFGLIVQGYSTTAKQGSGIGDNCIEIDGAEDSDAQPVTTAKIANFTVLGEPINGDGCMTWRDNARVQYRNCIFMDIGEEIVRYDGDDKDGANGYGYNGTLDWDATWATSYDTYPVLNWSTNVYATQAEMYTAQNSGNLAEIRGCLIYGYDPDEDDLAFTGNSVTKGDKGTSGSSVGAWLGTVANPAGNAALDNVYIASLAPEDAPIQSYARETVQVTYGPETNQTTKTLAVCTHIVPLAANEAVGTVTAGPVDSDGFFTPVPYRGAFSSSYNWLEGWTAVDAYGMTDTSMNADNPSVSIELVGTAISFLAESGVLYAVDVSADAATWMPVMTVEGTGEVETVADLVAGDFDDTKLYRVTVQ